MVSLDRYLSRVGHMLGMLVIGGSAVVKFFGANAQSFGFPKWLIPASILLTLATGVYNSITLKPKETMGNKRGLWSNLVYSKIAIMVGFPAVGMLVFGRETSQAALLDLIMTVVLVLIGSYCRFYREENTQKRS